MKNSTYKEKFAILDFWLPEIINSVKKDPKNDHLKNDASFCKKYFGNKNMSKLSLEEIIEGYRKALIESEQVEALGEFIANRWLMKNGDIYNFFAEQLSRINPHFDEIDEIDQQTSEAIIRAGHAQFSLQDLYLFSVFNAVAFPENFYADLGKNALVDAKHKDDAEASEEAEKSMEKLKRDHEIHFARMVDKYEKKLLGLEKKYHIDVETLKKQVARLQKQLAG